MRQVAQLAGMYCAGAFLSLVCLFTWHRPVSVRMPIAGFVETSFYCERCGCKCPIPGSRDEKFLKHVYFIAATITCLAIGLALAALINTAIYKV